MIALRPAGKSSRGVSGCVAGRKCPERGFNSVLLRVLSARGILYRDRRGLGRATFSTMRASWESLTPADKIDALSRNT